MRSRQTLSPDLRARGVYALGALVVLALGLWSRRVHTGAPLWDKSLGDVLYALLVGCLVAMVRPGTRPAPLGLVTFAVCFAVELFQITGMPARAPRIVQLALGTTFAWHDVACYAVGAVIVMVLRRRLA